MLPDFRRLRSAFEYVAITPPWNFGAADNVGLRALAEPRPRSRTFPAAPRRPIGFDLVRVAVTNDQVRPASRVLIAGQPPQVALSILPRAARPAVLAVASTDSGVTVQPADAYGHRAWRVIIPPVTQVGLAVRVNTSENCRPRSWPGPNRRWRAHKPPAGGFRHRGGLALIAAAAIRGHRFGLSGS